MTAIQSFTASQVASIEALCCDLSACTGHLVTSEYGSTDCGQHWAALCVEELPAGSWGFPGPLVSIVTGSGVPAVLGVLGRSEAPRGFGVLGASGVALADGVTFEEAMQTAQTGAVLEWSGMTEGALQV
jgi:hypothetical protein